MSCPVNKIDSNNTGLRYAEEECLKRLPSGTQATPATAILTFTGTGDGNDTFTIGSRTYTLMNAFDNYTDEIIIGGTAAETAARIAEAITTGYSAQNAAYIGVGTSKNNDASAAVDGNDVVFTSFATGTGANSLASTSSGSDLSFGDTTFEGGAEEQGVVPVWHVLEPNSYSDFGGQISTVARNPINPSRQRKKGVTSDLEASGGFNQDLTLNNTLRMLQGFFFADIREKFGTAPMNNPAVALGSVSSGSNTYSAAAGLAGFLAGQLVLASGFGISANNGLKRVATNSTASSLQVTGGTALENETTPPADANIQVVGRQFTTGEVALTLQGDLVRLTSNSTDLTTLGLIPGEWVYVGGDGAGNHFANSEGFARVSVIAAAYIEFDKVSWAPTVESGTGLTIQIFFGSIIRNEEDPDLIKRRTYQIERTLGRDGDGTMAEYLVGAVANELTLNVPESDKVNIDLSFVATDNEQRSGAEGVKSGYRPSLEPADAINTSSDFSRIKLARAGNNAAPEALFAFATELTLTINNGVTPTKALGVLGAFDTSAGTFEVGGSLTAYFADVRAVKAVRDNEDITLDVIMVKRGQGMLFDIPLLSLGDGRLNVEQDQAITLPLETNAAESKFGHTLLFQYFAYLPNIAG